eukprot:1993378-Rhodomonas_salina.1
MRRGRAAEQTRREREGAEQPRGEREGAEACCCWDLEEDGRGTRSAEDVCVCVRVCAGATKWS